MTINDECEVCHKEFKAIEISYRYKSQLMCRDCYDLHVDADNNEKMWLY
jgi:hypothetical protein